MNVKELNLTPAELTAILAHQQTLSARCGAAVTIEAAIEDFIANYREDWLREKQRRDLAEQRHEIEKHKYLRSQAEGRDIGRKAAAEEWCARYAPIWRAERESVERNGFAKITVSIQNEKGLHLRPASTLANLVAQFNCEVYFHRAVLEYYNFILLGKKYINVRSILGLLAIEAARGETLEFIAAGPQAREVLAAIANLVKSEFSGIETVPGHPIP